jgi:hypothetical protein
MRASSTSLFSRGTQIRVIEVWRLDAVQLAQLQLAWHGVVQPLTTLFKTLLDHFPSCLTHSVFQVFCKQDGSSSVILQLSHRSCSKSQ